MVGRDVLNLRTYLSTFAPVQKDTRYGKEKWGHSESGLLTPELALTGHVLDERLADVDVVRQQVDLASKEGEIRRACAGNSRRAMFAALPVARTTVAERACRR